MADIQHTETTALIPFEKRPVGSDAIETVNGRDLHNFLQVKTRFSDWITRRIQQYGFLQDIDLTLYSILSTENLQDTTEYFLTLDMAKQLSMVERNAKGREARQYFIACEKALKTPRPRVLPSAHDRLDVLKACTDALGALGVMDDRD